NLKHDIARLDKRAVTVLIYTAIGLTSIFYLKSEAVPAALLAETDLAWIGEWLTANTENNLPGLAWWVAVVTTFYFVVPVLIIKIWWRADLRDFGLRFGIERGFWSLLGVSTAIMLPLVYLMSLTEGFAAKYPFLYIFNGEPYLGTTLLYWELLYFIQFFGLEFFFRGFLVHSLKPSLGMYSIFVMTVPYCMIHFSKPPVETFSAIAAGIFLGWLSYRNGNIWLGLVLHCMVAFSMDIFALHAKGLLF
ncbi:MAG TPA: CPBP family intramembrane glutamic endopeptidase, partial [Pyrinomonadaceae bacterium]|nr:CPBP family intramembrane glutamic endopeptidase [Pyrinomonadaceae bacterium]